MAQGKEDVVAESMSGKLLDLDRRKVRVGREEGTMGAVGSMGATSSDDWCGILCMSPGGILLCCPRHATGMNWRRRRNHRKRRW
jgi:hypothetical protein